MDAWFFRERMITFVKMSLILKAEPVEQLLTELAKARSFQTQHEVEEWRQLVPFLKCYARQAIYPLRVVRDPGEVPDFTLLMADQTIGVELSTITNDQLEKSRVDQYKRFRNGRQLGAVQTASFQLDDRKRTTAERGREGLIMACDHLPPTRQALGEAWLANVSSRIDRKTRDMAQPRYQQGDQSWLLLRDRFSSSRVDLETRLPLLRDGLEPYWNQNRRFDWIILQARDFDAHFLLSSEGCGELVEKTETPENSGKLN